jgi:hypothetical protein
VFGLWLAHGSTLRPMPNEQWVMTGSLPLGRFARIRTTPGEDPVQAVASTALWPLVGLVTPELTEDQRLVWSGHVWAFIQERAALYETWPQVMWSLDSTPMPARVFRWAGAWTGFATTSQVAIIVVACAVNAEGLALEQVRNGHGYHFDISAPFDWPSFIEVSQAAAFQEDDGSWARGWPHHLDHQELLGGS